METINIRQCFTLHRADDQRKTIKYLLFRTLFQKVDHTEAKLSLNNQPYLSLINHAASPIKALRQTINFFPLPATRIIILFFISFLLVTTVKHTPQNSNRPATRIEEYAEFHGRHFKGMKPRGWKVRSN